MKNTKVDLLHIETVLIELERTFPDCFLGDSCKQPLKKNILKDLVAYYQDSPFINPADLKAALKLYTKDLAYLHCLKPGAMRIDLQGLPVNKVTHGQAQRARLLAKVIVATRLKHMLNYALESGFSS